MRFYLSKYLGLQNLLRLSHLGWPAFVVLVLCLVTVIFPKLGFAAQNDAVDRLASKTLVVAAEPDDVVAHYLFNALAEEFSLKIRYLNFPDYDGLLNAVVNGQADFAANITRTPAREKILDFSPPTNIEFVYLFSKENFSLEHARRIGVPQDTVFAELIRNNFPLIEIEEFDSVAAAVALLESGRVDGIVETVIRLLPMLATGAEAHLLNDSITIKPVSIVATKGQYVEELDLFSQFLHSDMVQKGLIQYVKRYQLDNRQKTLRAKVEKNGISGQVITVKLEDAAPYAKYAEDGSATGITADVVFEACVILDVRCELVSSAGESWESMYQDLIDNKIELLAPLTISPQRKEIFYFSKPHIVVKAVVAKRIGYKPGAYGNIYELVAERVGVVREDFYHTLLNELFPGKQLQLYDDYTALTEALKNKDIDYMVTDRITLNETVIKNKMFSVVEDDAIGSIHRSELAFGFPKTEQGRLLANLFSQALLIVDTEKIISRYTHKPNWQAIVTNEKKIALQTQFMFAFAFILLLVLGFAWLMRKQSHSDSLTKLKNSRALHSNFKRGLSKGQHLLYLDMNKFKEINDNYGHEVGDQVLLKYAGLLRRNAHGKCYRIGGDEFVIIGHSTDEQREHALAELEQFDFTVRGYNTKLVVSASIGVFLPNVADCPLRELLIYTDMAMYQAKRDRLAGAVFIDRVKFQDLQRKLEFSKQTEYAIEQQQLQAEFQPIRGLGENGLAFAVYLCWRSKGSYLDYKALKNHAEISGNLHKLELFAVQQSITLCKDLAEQQCLPEDFKLLISLTKQTLAHFEAFNALLHANPESKRYLVFIIDEREVTDPSLECGLKLLTEQGFQLALGDFGSHYCPLKPLQSDGFAYLKISAPILLEMMNQEKSGGKLLTLLEQLPQQYIVDSVNNEEQLARLESRGRYALQGEAVAVPVSAQALLAELSKKHKLS